MTTRFSARELDNGKFMLKVPGGRDLVYTMSALRTMSLSGLTFSVKLLNGKTLTLKS